MSNPIKLQAQVNEIKRYAGDVFIVKLRAEKKVKFKSGQFLHLTLDSYDPCQGYWPESRVFSIASSPNDEEIEICYSVKGDYTNRMKNELKEGKEIWLKMPYGDFIIEKHLNCERICLIAGGTGISPYISYLRGLNKNERNINLTLYYGIRDEKIYLYSDILENIKRIINYKLIIGMMDINAITDECVVKGTEKYLISGPYNMIKSFRETLNIKGVSEERIIIDEWE